MSRVRVNLSERSYDIEIGAGMLARSGEFVASRSRVSHAVCIADANVVSPYAESVEESLRSAGARVARLTIQPGERCKSVAEAERLWNAMLAAGADRKSVVIAVGGGVVGDLAGFVAATYARGLAFVQVPTTLLAQVDSSVGGKVGVNLPGAKNMVGAFWQPLGVLIDTATLATLPDREYRAGLGEVVKYGVILDAEFFAWLESHVAEINRRDAAALEHIITRCCRLKADVVEADERETIGLRAVLNYGHTFCHAIEAVTGYGEYLHGEAVAIGMMCAARLAASLGRIDQSLVVRQRELLAALRLPLETPSVDDDALLAAMQHDKKVEHGRLRFILPTRLGHVELVGDVAPELARAALRS
ncbi:MAG: 3-dehydroquinate synthase [Planctomycetes bacterium]|nr:3-dehydroquinate synthase [Planctomycetota bacterium]